MKTENSFSFVPLLFRDDKYCFYLLLRTSPVSELRLVEFLTFLIKVVPELLKEQSKFINSLYIHTLAIFFLHFQFLFEFFFV